MTAQMAGRKRKVVTVAKATRDLLNRPGLPPAHIDKSGRLHLCDSMGVEEFVCEYNPQTRKYYVNGVVETDPEMIASIRGDFRAVRLRNLSSWPT